MILRCVDSCIGAIGMLFESAGSWCWHHYGSFLCMMWQQFGTLQGLFRRLASQNSRLVLYINAIDPHLWTIYRPYTHALYRRNGSKLCDTETTIVPANHYCARMHAQSQHQNATWPSAISLKLPDPAHSHDIVFFYFSVQGEFKRLKGSEGLNRRLGDLFLTPLQPTTSQLPSTQKNLWAELQPIGWCHVLLSKYMGQAAY